MEEEGEPVVRFEAEPSGEVELEVVQPWICTAGVLPGAWSSLGITMEQPAEVPGVGQLATSLLFAHLE